MTTESDEKAQHVETPTGCTCGWRLPPTPIAGHGTFSAHRASVIHALNADRESKPCPTCGEVCTYDGWGLVHADGVGILSCRQRIIPPGVSRGSDE